ncbi:lysylphosphatidylglycerol synthase transmembrane domain-containing protein [uncultured Tateyamaria sp.]|uniref:lysylphosphatidylglycerol synthase transmembrane domain-containing protein n=1 Tax=uncultured Tateyamaria sp. TaxID=455651 RepID=UPI002637A16A|nr:lysylphosphatidylglycerol synthase transmembrane domain-containing protein [uncultured Tateyamaria sp.]
MTVRWLKLVVSTACVAVLLWWTDAAAVVERLQNADMMWITLGLLAITASTFAMASRWKIAASEIGVQITYPVAVREYYLAQLINTVLPGGVAGDVTRAVRARHTADLNRAAQSVMAERLLGQIAVLAFMFVGFAVALLVTGGLEFGQLGWVVMTALAGCIIVAVAVSRLQNATGRFLRITFQLTRRPVVILHGLITTLCLVFGFYACARATGVIMPAEALATLIPLILCAMLIPLSVGGWGWREGAAAALFPIIGAPASAGVATGITYGVVLLAAALPAAVILVAQPPLDTASSKGKPDLP